MPKEPRKPTNYDDPKLQDRLARFYGLVGKGLSDEQVKREIAKLLEEAAQQKLSEETKIEADRAMRQRRGAPASQVASPVPLTYRTSVEHNLITYAAQLHEKLSSTLADSAEY